MSLYKPFNTIYKRVDPSQIMRNFNRDLYINLNFQFFILVVRVCSYPQYPGGNIDVYDWGHSGEMRSAILKIPFYNMLFSLSYPNLRIYWILFLGHSPQVSSRTSTRKQRRVLCPRALPLVSIFFCFWMISQVNNQLSQGRFHELLQQGWCTGAVEPHGKISFKHHSEKLISPRWCNPWNG